MRINKMITQEKMPLSIIKFSRLILQGNVWRSVWRICLWILGLKGLTSPLFFQVAIVNNCKACMDFTDQLKVAHPLLYFIFFVIFV